jgi:hypothetical protein
VDAKAQLLRRAVASHEKLTRGAATGKGVDRHLFGLSLMFSTDSELFTDPLYAKSQEWKMSTSGLSAGHLFQGTGYVFMCVMLGLDAEVWQVWYTLPRWIWNQL